MADVLVSVTLREKEEREREKENHVSDQLSVIELFFALSSYVRFHSRFTNLSHSYVCVCECVCVFYIVCSERKCLTGCEHDQIIFLL